jgi:multisubunit Na+/H+ antiporter MnhC subunit
VNDINDPVWSVIILLCCGLAFTAYCVIYILRLAFQEMEEDVQETQGKEEGQTVQAVPGECDGEKS